MTGARIGEIAQLRPDDIQFSGDVHFFNINENDGKTVKTASSIRSVPVHSQLIHLGILELAAQREGRVSLLPKIPKAIKGDAGHWASNWMRENFL
jgi:integrase